MILYLFLGIFLASAQEDGPEYAKAKQAYIYGKQLFEEGDYFGAIQAFERAYKIMPQKVDILFNIALAYQFSGDLEAAKEVFLEYQRVAPTSQWMEAQTRIKNIDAQLKKKQMEKIEAAVIEEPPPKGKPLVMPKEAVYSMWGLGAVGIGSGVYFGIQQSQSRSTIDTYCIETICKGAASDALLKQKTHALYADIGWAIGLAATGAALWFTVNPTQTTSIAIYPEHISLTGSF